MWVLDALFISAPLRMGASRCQDLYASLGYDVRYERGIVSWKDKSTSVHSVEIKEMSECLVEGCPEQTWSPRNWVRMEPMWPWGSVAVHWEAVAAQITHTDGTVDDTISFTEPQALDLSGRPPPRWDAGRLPPIYILGLTDLQSDNFERSFPKLSEALRDRDGVHFSRFTPVNSQSSAENWMPLLFGSTPASNDTHWFSEAFRQMGPVIGHSDAMLRIAPVGRRLATRVQEAGYVTGLSYSRVADFPAVPTVRDFDHHCPYLMTRKYASLTFKPNYHDMCNGQDTFLETLLRYNRQFLEAYKGKESVTGRPGLLVTNLQTHFEQSFDEALAKHVNDLPENVAVFFLSPHGPIHGHPPDQHPSHPPLIISPGMDASLREKLEQSKDFPLTAFDLHASIFDLAGLSYPETVSLQDGSSIMPRSLLKPMRERSWESMGVRPSDCLLWEEPHIQPVGLAAPRRELFMPMSYANAGKGWASKHELRSGSSIRSAAPMGNSTLEVNGKLLTYDDILFGYDLIFEDLQLYRRGRWQGVPMQQNPSDLLAISDLLWRVRPDVLVEIGTGLGGSAIFFKSLMHDYNENAVLVTIDVIDTIRVKVDHPLWESPNLIYLQGQSRDSHILAAVRGVTNSARTVVVIHDGSHNVADVHQDLLTYSGMVTLGSYLIVQDTKLDRIERTQGPMRAVRKFLSGPGRGKFVIDKSWEYFLYSQHHDGYLRRIARQ